MHNQLLPNYLPAIERGGRPPLWTTSFFTVLTSFFLQTRTFPNYTMAKQLTKKKGHPKKGVGPLNKKEDFLSPSTTTKLSKLALNGAGPQTRSASHITTRPTDLPDDAEQALQELLMDTEPPKASNINTTSSTENEEEDQELLGLRD